MHFKKREITEPLKLIIDFEASPANKSDLFMRNEESQAKNFQKTIQKIWVLKVQYMSLGKFWTFLNIRIQKTILFYIHSLNLKNKLFITKITDHKYI